MEADLRSTPGVPASPRRMRCRPSCAQVSPSYCLPSPYLRRASLLADVVLPLATAHPSKPEKCPSSFLRGGRISARSLTGPASPPNFSGYSYMKNTTTPPMNAALIPGRFLSKHRRSTTGELSAAAEASIDTLLLAIDQFSEMKAQKKNSISKND
ncbi:hypothetical protein M441DRAFT_409038 [Trichoderma asperellum CBS 433.97]|uniref:Uncharacterized protein n=1 Tax=Trichoderma asperellum (strain ATCC 204424 / CBS 433.97 / NBRC 101777) TaxID=1042311 RepID=A0A2T3Z6Z2_TRIA4|nr:hypothetical protein M441DRAFT_409038 [Trichoderma asperellum CBS 433.97]PTB40601.1 hypothetical protein M441DRAFT_409038 [Trichoderma asperellum CBS 433.97]